MWKYQLAFGRSSEDSIWKKCGHTDENKFELFNRKQDSEYGEKSGKVSRVSFVTNCEA